MNRLSRLGASTVVSLVVASVGFGGVAAAGSSNQWDNNHSRTSRHESDDKRGDRDWWDWQKHCKRHDRWQRWDWKKWEKWCEKHRDCRHESDHKDRHHNDW